MNGKMVLHFLLVTAFAAAGYPLIVLLCCRSGHSLWFALFLTALLILAAWIGMLHILFLRRQYRKKPYLVNGTIWAVAVLLFLTGIFFLPFSSVFLRGVYGIAAGGCYFGASRLVFQPTENLTHPYVFSGLCIWVAFLGILLYFCHADGSLLPIILILAGNAVLFAVSHNCSALEQMLYSRGEVQWELPHEIRRCNRHLMVLLCLLGIGLLCFYRPVAKLLRQLWRWIYTGIWYFLYWLLSIGSNSAEDMSLSEAAMEVRMPVQQNTVAQWISLGISAVVCAVLLVFLIWKRRTIHSVLVQRWCALRRWLEAHFKKVPLSLEEEHGAYCDYMENLSEERGISSVAINKVPRHKWKRVFRRYRHMPRNAARYRLGYALLLERLPEHLACPSDSTGEILQKLCAAGETDKQWKSVTDGYDAVRYGEQEPSEKDFAALDALLQKMERTVEVDTNF